MKLVLSLLALLPLTVVFTSAPAAQYYQSDPLSTVIQGPQRSVAHKLRDKYRHPHATLEFFGVKPDMTVVELDPGGGWYTEILAPYLKDHGKLIEAAPPLDSKSDFMRRMAKKYRQKLKKNEKSYGHVTVVSFAPPKQVKLGRANSVDRVLTFRNAHDLAKAGALEKTFKAAYKVLKPGGVLGVVAHRANPDTDPLKDAQNMSRLPEAYVINIAQKAGFKLDAISRINANPADPRTTSVFMLPPTRAADRMKKTFDQIIDKSNAKHPDALKSPIDPLQSVFDHIGESDRMTLKFVKRK
jgi:predicted methyltransferase